MLCLVAAAAAGCSSGPAARVAASPLPPLPGASSAGAAVPNSSSPSPPAADPAPPTPAPSPSSAPARTSAPTLPPETPVDPLSPRPPLETAPPPGRPTCVPADLTITDADRQYTADAVQALFTVRTTGPDCQLASDYPAVSVLDATGAALAPAANGGFGLPAPGGSPITLSRSTSLSFFLASGRDDGCPPAARIVVTFAGTSTAVTAATDMAVCGGALGIGPVQRLGDDE